MSLVIDDHREYLADRARVSAFREAIREVVEPGDVVLDLGAGTGVLGLLACEAGAKRVYSIEGGGVIELAREICRANGLEERVVFIRGLSTRVDLPEKVDLVVADQIGRFGFEAGLLEYFQDARERFLKPGGRMIPSRVDLWVAPVECPEMWEQVEFWNGRPAGFDFRPARRVAANTAIPGTFPAEQLLGDPAVVASLDLAIATMETLRVEASIEAKKAGRLHGIGGGFSARLSRNVIMANSPLATTPIHRRNVFFPIGRPVALAKGDQVRIAMHILPTEQPVVAWNVEVWSGQEQDPRRRKARFAHSTLQGMLISKEDLIKTHPHAIPRLSPLGKARLSVLSLCDGHRAVSEIEEEVFRRHPDLFRSPGDAAKFAAELLTRYSE